MSSQDLNFTFYYQYRGVNKTLLYIYPIRIIFDKTCINKIFFFPLTYKLQVRVLVRNTNLLAYRIIVLDKSYFVFIIL